MTNNHHSVLLVESEDKTRRLLHQWLHSVEEDIEIDEAETAAEARDRLRTGRLDGYDLVIADEDLMGTNTGFDLYRYCAANYPSVPFLMTAHKAYNAYLIDQAFPATSGPLVINPDDPRLARSLIQHMLAQKPKLHEEVTRTERLKFTAILLALSGLLAIAPFIQTMTQDLIKSPSFTERIQPVPTTPSLPVESMPEEILAPPPPREVVTPIDMRTVFTPRLKAQMAEILATADDIVMLLRLPSITPSPPQ